MPETQNTFDIGWSDVTLRNGNFDSLIPTGGNWGGPGWSGGKRTAPDEAPNRSIPQAENAFKQPSQVDAACKQHDLDYWDARNSPDKYLLTLEADIRLLTAIANINPNQIDANEKIYAKLVTYAFFRKVMYDTAMTANEQKCNAVVSLFNQICTNLKISMYGEKGFYGGFYDRLNREGTIQAFQRNFKSAETARRVDPLILDLDGDGIETTNVKDGAYFDHDGNGFAEQTGWASSDDGLLVMDRKNNGTIDNSKELFGDQTILQNGQRATDGFQALAELDTNNDGIIDANDIQFSQIRIWQDVDGDGYSATDELFTLQEMGIQSINVAHTDTNTTDPQGNTKIQAGAFFRTDNLTASIGGFNLQRDVTYSIANEWLDVPDNIAVLPDLQGYGNAYDLHQAMVRDTTGTLQSLIEQFIAAEDPTTRDSLMEQILFKWTGSDTINPSSRGGNFDAREPQSHYLS